MELLVALGLLINAASFWLSNSEPDKCLVQIEGVQSWQPCTDEELQRLHDRETAPR